VAAGVAIVEPDDTPETLLERADAAMYREKRARAEEPVGDRHG
jgi:PleD family two-component response regulator